MPQKNEFGSIKDLPGVVLRRPELGVKIGTNVPTVANYIQNGLRDPNFDEKIPRVPVWVASIEQEGWESRVEYSTPWAALEVLRRENEFPNLISPSIGDGKNRRLYLTFKDKPTFVNLYEPYTNPLYLLRWLRRIVRDCGATQQEVKLVFRDLDLNARELAFAAVEEMVEEAEADGDTATEVDVTKITLESLGLEIRYVNSFSAAGVITLGDAANVIKEGGGKDALKKLPGIADGAVNALEKVAKKARAAHALKEPEKETVSS